MTVPGRYDPVLVALHWILAAMITASLIMGTFVLAPMPNDAPGKSAVLLHHMQIGIIIFLLMMARLLVRQVTARPPRAETGHRLLNVLSLPQMLS